MDYQHDLLRVLAPIFVLSLTVFFQVVMVDIIRTPGGRLFMYENCEGRSAPAEGEKPQDDDSS